MNDKKYYPERANNADLLDLLIIILKYKWLILGCLLLVYVVTFSFFYFSDSKSAGPVSSPKERYYSECKLFLPENLGFVDYNMLKARLLSRGIAVAIGETLNLPTVHQVSWDEKNNKWITEQVYVRNEQTKVWTSAQLSTVRDPDAAATLSVKTERNMVVLRFKDDDPKVPQKALECGLTYLSESYRKPALDYYNSQKEIFRSQLENARDPVLKGRLFEQYSNLLDRDTRAKNAKFYGLEIIEPAFIPEKISADAAPPLTRKPKYGIIIALVTLISFVISISFIFFIEYIQKMKKSDPERFDLIKKYLHFR